MSNLDFWAKEDHIPLIDRWPKKEDGSPVEPEMLLHVDAIDMQDTLTINMLEAYGIPCFRGYPGDGSFGKIILGMSGQGVDIFVPSTMSEDARQLLQGEIDHDEL